MAASAQAQVQAQMPEGTPPKVAKAAMAFSNEIIRNVELYSMQEKGFEDEAARNLPDHPEYRPLWQAAVREQATADHDLLTALLARRLVVLFNLEELEDGAVLLRDPMLLARIKARSRGEPDPVDLPPKQSSVFILRTTAGQMLLLKLNGAMRSETEQVAQEYAGIALPSIRRRFADKVLAASK